MSASNFQEMQMFTVQLFDLDANQMTVSFPLPTGQGETTISRESDFSTVVKEVEEWQVKNPKYTPVLLIKMADGNGIG